MASLDHKSSNPIAILKELNRLPTSELLLNSDIRQQALSLSQKLSRSLEDPVSYATQVVFTVSAPFNFDGLKTTEHDPGTGNFSINLQIGRGFRWRGAVGEPYLTDVGLDRTVGTAFRRPLGSHCSVRGHGIAYCDSRTPIYFRHASLGGIRGPKFLRENGFTAPVEPHDGFVQYANQTKLDLFGFMQTMPALMGDFNTFMGHQKGKKAYWYDWSPVDEILFRDFDATKSVLMVDIGGGRGHDLQAFHTRFPGRGQLILQDLPQVITSIGPDELDSSIQRQVYDHFTIQPVTGARAYFLHRILHQWSDKYCLEILSNTRRAMSPGYSKLLINELVLPNVGASTYQCTFDIAMMAANGGIERSQQQWKTLLEHAGFKDIKFWTNASIGDGLIEAQI